MTSKKFAALYAARTTDGVVCFTDAEALAHALRLGRVVEMTEHQLVPMESYRLEVVKARYNDRITERASRPLLRAVGG